MMFAIALRRPVLLIAALLVFAAGGTVLGDDIDHEEVRRLTQTGVILPLAEIVATVGKRVPGDVLEVELEREDGVYVYELKILRKNGRVQEVEADAATGRIVAIEDDD